MNIPRKKLILIIIASFFGVLLLSAFGFAIYFNLQFSVYHDDQYQFSIRYPTAWQVVIHPRPDVAVEFLRPKDTGFDIMRENFNVTVQPLPKDITTLEDFSNRIKAQMIAVFGTNTKFVMYKPVQWGWRKGYKLSIEAPRPDNLKMINAWVIREKESYILTFLGQIDKYPQDKLYVNEMIRSLKLDD